MRTGEKRGTRAMKGEMYDGENEDKKPENADKASDSTKIMGAPHDKDVDKWGRAHEELPHASDNEMISYAGTVSSKPPKELTRSDDEPVTGRWKIWAILPALLFTAMTGVWSATRTDMTMTMIFAATASLFFVIFIGNFIKTSEKLKSKKKAENGTAQKGMQETEGK